MTSLVSSIVEQGRFGGEPHEDIIRGASEGDEETIRAWLSVTGWEAFCGEEWETRRKAYDARQARS